MVAHRRRALSRIAWGTVAVLTLFAWRPSAACDDRPGAAGATPERSGRGLTAEGLIGLREIGNPDSSLFGLPSPLAIDPSGRRVAFVLSQADPGANRYCRSLVMLSLDGTGEPEVLDRGGERMSLDATRAGILVASGVALDVTPQWSPDGKAIAYLRRDGGINQLWVSRPGEHLGRPTTRSAVDVESFAWSADGLELRYSSRPERARVEKAIVQEAGQGFLYDARFVPTAGPKPQMAAGIPVEQFAVTLSSGDVQSVPDAVFDVAGDRRAATVGWQGSIASVSLSPLSLRQVVMTSPSGVTSRCDAAACIGRPAGVWPVGQAGDALFLRREGWNGDTIALYRWTAGSRDVHRMLQTSDVLNGCAMAKNELICLRESATRPRRVVGIDVETGKVRDIYDPNPQMRDWVFGPVRRLRWRNANGLEVYGDLVLPPNIPVTRMLPLIVVQYRSTGFLRGGTGDEYPIHLFAQAGFAVLSVERPTFVAAAATGLKTATDVNAYNLKDWAERRSLLSAIETGVQKVIDLGIADPTRIGITGLSDGATTARFALINSRMFAAAAISSCCVDPRDVLTLAGPAYADVARQIGYPALTDRDDARWKPLSLGLNASRLATPLLMQLADDEYLLALDSFMSLREQTQPAEMFVFPGEHHIKVQPAHRLAIYRRNLDWFSFWLLGKETNRTGDATQIARWRALRDRLREPKTSAVRVSAPILPTLPHR